MNTKPIIAICSIMCNAEFLLEEWLEHYYYNPYIDYIYIVEGATKAWATAHNYKTPRSADSTFEILNKWIKKDNKKKIQVIIGKDFYSEKTQQCNMFMPFINSSVTHILTLDADEFLMYEDIEKLRNLIINKNITYAEFKFLNFFKGINYIGIGGDGWGYDASVPRLFSYEPNSKYLTHRPPTILNSQGVDVSKINPLACEETIKMDILVRHYSYIQESSVKDKLAYYDIVFPNIYGIKNFYSEVWFKEVWQKWTEKNRKKIEKKYSLHPTGKGAISERYKGQHPKVILDKFNI